MSDEKTEQEKKSTPIHELSETPFGSSFSETQRKEEPLIAEVGPVETPEQPAEEAEPISMEAAMAAMDSAGVDYSGAFKALRVGDVVDGIVVHIDHEGVMVDVGTKSEGIIRPNELTRDSSLSPEDVVTVGEKIKVYVLEPESSEGGPVLSKRKADFENAWEKVEKAHSDGETLKAMVTDRVKGGLVVDLGIRGFVPASHVGGGKLKNLDKYVGQSMPFKVIEVDRERRKVVLSNRLAVEEEMEGARRETVGSLAEGQIREGLVRRITDYGAFVDLGGVDGLLHISEISWTRINHPSEAVKVGQKIQVMVLKLNLEHGRRLYTVGQVVTATVSRLVPFGAFIQVGGGVEGIIPNSELAHRRINSPEDVVSVGQEVEVKIIDIRSDERRMTLSLKQLQVQQEREREDKEYKTHTQTRQDAGKTTIGDIIGEQLGDISFAQPEEEKPKKKARSRKKEVLKEAEAIAEAKEDMAVEQEIAAEAPAEEVLVAEVVVEEALVEETAAPDVPEVEAAEVVTEIVEAEASEVAEAEAPKEE
jgi:ribosomal protein S1